MADCKWPSRARIPGGLVPGTVARGRLAFLAARTVTAPPGRDMANSATSPILQQRQPELQVGGVAYRCPIEFRHQVGTLGRPTWRTTAPGGRTLFGRWFPGALRIRSRVLVAQIVERIASAEKIGLLGATAGHGP